MELLPLTDVDLRILTYGYLLKSLEKGPQKSMDSSFHGPWVEGAFVEAQMLALDYGLQLDMVCTL